ncbi:heme-binding domain-containing protein [Spongiimicrobium salis]|uniref:heme-binding domain-containing protein n=1 Tax=Spongiimicrobium salis TaxID=1667022 RepID=UPI00374D0B11
MKIVKKILTGLLILLVALQFYRPDKNTSESDHMATFLSETNPPAEVQRILENSCYDCHSDHTTYPWYGHIAPVSYWLDDHIKHGKGNLNFSDWENYSRKEKDHKLEELEEEVEKGKMPIENYTLMHADTKLSQQQKEAIAAWVRQTRALYQLGQRPN